MIEQGFQIMPLDPLPPDFVIVPCFYNNHVRVPRFDPAPPPGFISLPWASLAPETPTSHRGSMGIIIITIVVKRKENLINNSLTILRVPLCPRVYLL
jgi:hypothetical protein